MNIKSAVTMAVEAFPIKGGKHLKLNQNATLFKERGITDIWCYTKPETGSPMLYLEGEKGNLIREFNLKTQLEQVRYYFNKANASRNQILKLKQEYKRISQEIKVLEDKCQIKNCYNEYYDIERYEFAGMSFNSLGAARGELIRRNPEMIRTIGEIDILYMQRGILSKQLDKAISKQVWRNTDPAF